MDALSHFRSIDELVKMLDRERMLFRDMFERRKTLSYRMEFALEFTEYKKDRIRFLIDHGVIHENGDFPHNSELGFAKLYLLQFKSKNCLTLLHGIESSKRNNIVSAGRSVEVGSAVGKGNCVAYTTTNSRFVRNKATRDHQTSIKYI